MGRKDISPEPIDRVPACGADMACHITKCGKNITQTSLYWYSYRCHSKSDNLMSVIRYNGKNIKSPSTERTYHRARSSFAGLLLF